jgi:hypothetical protein
MTEIPDYISECIKSNIPVQFCKYGDGEYLCSNKNSHNSLQNCDKDTYTQKLSDSVTNSFKYITSFDNAFIGMWEDTEIIKYWENLSKNVNWVSYHLLIFDQSDLISNNIVNKIKIYKAVKESKLKKIIICNELLIKSKVSLNIDNLVLVPFNNWFDSKFDEILNKVKKIIGDQDGNHIVLTSCGMSAKVLIAELHKLYPKGIYLDVGSGLDLICTKRDSRGQILQYDLLYNKFKEQDFIPDGWDNPEYDYIYNEAFYKLGTHLPK